VKITSWNILDHIKTNKDILLYLENALEENNDELILAILEDIKNVIRNRKIVKKNFAPPKSFPTDDSL
jgi:DNA-binding phage protein